MMHTLNAVVPKPISTTFRRPWTHAAEASRSPIQPSLYECLRSLDLFTSLSDPDLLKLAALGRERRLDKGDFIVRQDDAQVHHLFVLLEGEAVMVWEDGEGCEALLATLRSGETVGEMALFDAAPQPATVRVTAPARVLLLHRDAVMQSLRESPDLGCGLLREMSRRLQACYRRISGICNQGAPRRVASVLLGLLEDRGTRLRDEAGRRCLLLRQRPKQSHIAELAGTARETVSRFLALWERQGWLTQQHGDLWITDEARLRRLAGE